MQADTPPVCDYEGSDYRTRFWEGQGRSYEDQVERIALRRLMPATGSTLLEIGAGYGRLADEYRGYERVVLFDYSRSLLREAQGHLKNDPRFLFVAGNWYKMPFVAGLFETLVQIRTIHHAADVPALMAQLARIARPHGQYILEFANKKNLKAIFRYLLRRQNWSPFTPEPIEFATLNFDFQTNWIRQQLSQAGFKPGQMLTTSHYRIPLLKKIIPMSLLVQLDSLAQWTGNWWQLSPSVFVYNQHPQTSAAAVPHQFFACPECQTSLAESSTDRLLCTGCGRAWAIRDGLYDFKEPVNPSD
ncbi:MAG: class I SAM-dependent methyltransferase [Chloroflexi bacterium]|nr:class I SAM-dependent methyltransferase [Chloroflexota bacterium]MBP8056507.1 class I SAM-dependent methyltransferase [Chloroflexota bacterium]